MQNPIAVVATAFVLSVGGAIAVTQIAAPSPAPPARPDTMFGAELDDLRAQLDTMQTKLRAFEGRLTEFRAPVREATGVDRDEVERIVHAVLAAGDGAGIRPAKAKPTAMRVGDAGAHLLEHGVNTGDASNAYWEKIRDAGLTDEVVAAFEARAEANPDSADAQFDLGSAYIQKIMAVDSDIQKGVWAMKADAKFDDALSLDETHWGARFSKAVSYSFYPPVMGMAGKAIEQFEVLVDQQAAQASQPHFAQTYVFLGNMYAQQGKTDKAREIWQRGLTLHPGNTQLVDKLK